MKTNCAFTLVELLVVISIVVSLSAILLPVLQTGRAKSRQTVCVSNMRQIGMAIEQYTQDNDEMLPCDPVWGLRGYGVKIYPYVTDLRIYHCPEDDSNPELLNYNSYAGNENLGTLHGPGDGNDGPPIISALNAPNLTVLLSEIWCPWPSGIASNLTSRSIYPDPYWFPCTDGVLKPEPNEMTSTGAWYNDNGQTGGRPFVSALCNAVVSTNCGWVRSFAGRHSGGANYVFSDGHVQWVQGDKVSSGRSNANAFCNQDNAPPVAGCNSGSSALPYAAGTEGTMNGVTAEATFGVY